MLQHIPKPYSERHRDITNDKTWLHEDLYGANDDMWYLVMPGRQKPYSPLRALLILSQLEVEVHQKARKNSAPDYCKQATIL